MGNPATPDAYLALAMARALKRGRDLVDDLRPLVAYVNDGRWIADCPHCHAGIAIDPDWPVAPCLGTGCYRVYRAIILPDDRHDIERALLHRPLRNQHWGFHRGVSRNPQAPAETVDDLARENDAHGVRSYRA